MWLICLLLSVTCLVASAVIVVVVNKKRGTKKRKINMVYALLAGVFLAAIVMFFAVHNPKGELSLWGIGKAILLSLFNGMQIIPSGCEFSVVEDQLVHCPEWLREYYRFWAAALFTCAPILTVGAVMSLFKNLFAKMIWRGVYFKDAYVFSQLNEKTINLALDIRENHPKAAIVFTDVNEEDVSIAEWLEEAKRIGAICFSADILSVSFGKHSTNKAIYFLAMNDDEGENLNRSLKLIERYKHRPNTHLFVFSTKIDSELALTSVDKGQMKVRRINKVRAQVNRWLYEQGTVLFESARPQPDGEKTISAVVVGMGAYGTEMVKALAWYCQMDGYQIKINAFDRDPLAEDKFVALAPELMHPDYNGVRVPGEAQYQIIIHSGMNVQTGTFARAIAGITDATYVIVSLGSDEVNIDTAIRLRMYFERSRIHPVIQAIVNDAQQRDALIGIKNYKGQAYDIQFIGDLESSYTEGIILNSKLEEEALQRHLKWGKEETFWSYEYNYRSSVATAIHRHARIFCGIPGADKDEGTLSIQERDGIEDLEHRRWNAYMRSEGYVYSGSDTEESRNDLGKMHNDLVNFSQLSEEEKRKDSRVGTA